MIKRTQITFLACGESFRPSSVTAPFSNREDPGDIGSNGRYRGKPLPSGSASFDVPEKEKDGIRYLHALVYPLLPILRAAGATDFTVSITYHYEDQCALGFDPEETRMLADFECPVHVDCWPEQEAIQPPQTTTGSSAPSRV
ncbi:MAG: hypothetical protein PSW75_09905 [bacterium]|nr:hypothetical protein [bacterium]MDI1336906.1 hypothetical protein [Lacunisphaera sp.]